MGKKQYSVRTAAVAATERRARRSGVAVAASGSGSSYNELYGDIAGKLDKEAFDSMFERVSDGVDADGVEHWYIRAKASLVSVGDLTAYGLNGSAGDGAGPGAGVTELRSLDDVILTDPKAGQILKYDGKHWINGTVDTGLDEAALAAYLATNRYAKTSDIPSLVGYATQIWVEGKSYATEAWVNAKGYLTQHQDISHLLTREEFESMFERVDMGNGQWYILAKSHLASVGDITAYGTSGPGSTLGGIGDVTLGSLAAGDVIMWNGQKWVNGQAPGGGLDEEQLAAYLTANNYITQADLGNYVTVDGGQTITGAKTFGSGAWILQSSESNEITHRYMANSTWGDGAGLGAIRNGIDFRWFDSHWVIGNIRSDSTPSFGFGIGSLTSDGKLTPGLRVTTDGIYANAFVKSGGTASQFLMADGSVKALADVTSAYVTALGTSGDYLTWTKDGVTNNITVPFATSTDFLNGVVPTAITDAPGNYKARLYVNVLSGTAGLFPSINNSNAILTISRHGGNYYSQLGFSSNGNMYYRSFNYVALDTTTAWDLVLTSGNYTSTLDSRYVNKAGDITTGNLCINTDSRYTSYNEGLRINANSGNGWATMFFGGAYGSTADVSNNGFIVAVNPQHQFVIAQGQSATNYGLSIVGTGASDLRWLNNTIWHAGNDGSGSGLDADLLDGLHADSFVRQLNLGQQYDTHGAYVVLCPAYSGAVTNGGYFYGSVTITRGSAWSYNAKSEIRVQCGGQYNSNQGGYQNLYNNVGIGGLYVITYNGTSYIALYMQPSSTMDFWVSGRWSGVTPFLIDAAASGLSVGAAIATTPHINSNALSASKLQTARTIYINSYNNYRVGDGVAFDGTGDITLKLPNTITASDWFRSYGATGWYSETYGGGIYMVDTTWVRTFNNKGFYCSKEIQSSETFNRTVYGGSSWNNGYGAYNVAIYNNANQTPLLHAYRDGAGVAATGANRLFAIELLNSGALLRFGFGGAEKFEFHNSGYFITWGDIRSFGNILASGDVTAYSDARLKSDIRPLTNRGFITPRTYIKDGKRCIGFLAQEVQQKYPELVMDTGGADHWLSLNYGNLVAVLEAQIIDHEDRLKRLEARI